MNLHRLAEARSLEYHRRVAGQLARDPALLTTAKERVRSWIAERRSAEYAAQWQALLERPLNEIAALLVEDSERARALRQSTPFAGAIPPKERWRIWSEVRTLEERKG